ncbi:hypothetical protein [Oryzobacter telluris]|uniref:hypothetical protein n=1 Tax=Oryzobacter telluris TaxID=3149179 RepID=UPI00370D95A2
MSIHADPLFITAEVERRLELAGVHRDGHHHDAPAPLALHPLALVVARLVRGRGRTASSRPAPGPVATRRPRHP